MTAPKFTPGDLVLAGQPCRYRGKPGWVCSMLPSPVKYCATCSARIAIGNAGLAELQQARAALAKAVQS